MWLSKAQQAEPILSRMLYLPSYLGGRFLDKSSKPGWARQDSNL